MRQSRTTGPARQMFLITPPESEPVTLAQAKQHVSVTHSEHDEMLLRLITIARNSIERITGRALMPQVWEQREEDFVTFHSTIELFRPPCIEVLSLKYIDRNDVLQPLDPSKYYVAPGGRLGRTTLRPINFTLWPLTHLYEPQRVRIQFRAGFDPQSDFYSPIPSEIVQAILLFVGHYYNNRDEVVLTQARETFAQMPKGSEDLLADYVDFYFA